MDASSAHHDDDEQLIARLAALDLATLASDGRWQTCSRTHRLEWLTCQAVGLGIGFASDVAVSWSLCERVDFVIGAEGRLARCKQFVDCGAVE